MDAAAPPLACPACASPMVRRLRRSDGAAFLGCSRYPACHGTREIAAGPPAPPQPPPPPASRPSPPPSIPGASARAAFAKRDERHRARVRERRPWIIARGVVIATVGLVLAALGGSWMFAGLALVVIAVLSTVVLLFGTPDSVRAWDTGAAGEERTAAALAALSPDAFLVLHDLRKPGSRANIDHLVIGPTGVWVVETKSYRGELRVRHGDLFIAGRRKTGFIDQVQGQAAAISAALAGVPVLPILCVHRAGFPLASDLSLGGVRIVGARGLIEAIGQAPVVLRPDEVAGLAALAEQRLRTATR